MKRSTARLLAICLSLPLAVGVLFAVEGALVLLDVAPPTSPLPIALEGNVSAQQTIQWDPDLLYRYAPSSEFLGFYRTNALGYRGDEFTAEKPAQTIRIVCVGDSCTFGLGLRENEMWSSRLASALDRAYVGVHRFEVLGLGVVGYSSFQNRRQLELEVPRFAPDVVIYMPTAFNDATLAPQRTDSERAQENHSWSMAIRRSRVARLLGALAPQFELPSQIELAAAQPNRRCRVSLAERRENLEVAIAVTRASGAKLVLVRFASAQAALTIDPSLAERARLVSEVANERQIPCVDAENEFRKYAPYELYSDGVHPSALGARVIASQLLESLIESEVLPDDARRRFLRIWLEARRQGFPAIESSALESALAGAPTEFGSLLDGLDGKPIPAALDATLRRDDPLLGSARSAYGLGWLALEGDHSGTVAAHRFAEIESNVIPRDSFARFLGIQAFTAEKPAARDIRLARAATVYESLVDIAPPPIDRRLGIASAALFARDLGKVVAVTAEILRLDPSCTDAEILLARANGYLGNRGAMQSAVDSALTRDPNHPGALALAGVLALERRDIATAQPLLDRAIAANPFDLDCRYGLARLLVEKGDKERARAELKTLLTINRRAFPDAVDLYRAVGGVLPDEAAGASGTEAARTEGRAPEVQPQGAR